MLTKIRNCIAYTFMKVLLLGQSLRTVFAVMVWSNWKPSLLTHQSPKKSECVILGNGPSLKDSFERTGDGFFSDKEIFCVNDFAHSEHFLQLKPRYYVIADSACWNRNASETIKERYRKSCQKMAQSVDWAMVLLLPHQARNWNFFIDLPSINPKISICYYNTTTAMGFENLRSFLLRKNLAAPPAHNVLIISIFLSINLGFKKIFLFGADHSWHENVLVNNDNQVCWADPHFYDKKPTPPVPAYRDPTEADTVTIAELFSGLADAFAEYPKLNDYAHSLGVTIFNASQKSYIDAFPRRVV